MPADTARPRQQIGYDTLTEGQKDMALDLAGVGITSVDYIADTVTPDARAAELFGLAPGVPVTRDAFHARIHPGDLPEVLGEVDKLLDPDFDDIIEVTHRTLDATGATRWVSARKRLYRDEDDPQRKVQTGIAIVLDITAARDGAERTELLIREMRHRTGNIVAVVSAIARMVMRSGPADEFLDRFLPRLWALSSRLRLDAPENGRTTLRATIEDALTPFLTPQSRVTLTGPDVTLAPDKAETYAMIAHELATNAVKYGAWSRVGGSVQVGWTVEANGTLDLSWREQGGPPLAAQSKSGFGSQVLEQFAPRMLSAAARLDFGPGGLAYTLSVPGTARST